MDSIITLKQFTDAKNIVRQYQNQFEIDKQKESMDEDELKIYGKMCKAISVYRQKYPDLTIKEYTKMIVEDFKIFYQNDEV